VTRALIEKALRLGACAAGVAAVEDLRAAPSFVSAPRDFGEGEVRWPEGARSVLVVAVEHPEARPELDWWFGRVDPPGNRILAGIVRELCGWVTETFGMATSHLPYHVEKGGIYLKDAAVLAGLGCIGRNNLLVTPTWGPRVRLRALTMSAEIRSTGPTGFDPCLKCVAPCLSPCPRGAFVAGGFSRAACRVQMDADIDAAVEQSIDGVDEPTKIIKYCRRCESTCVVGR